MSTLIRAEVLGYCMGVRRAMDTAEKALENYCDSPVYSLGPLIHNKAALENLINRGLLMLEDTDFAVLCADAQPAPAYGALHNTSENNPPKKTKSKPPVVIIRAHGTTPEVREKLKKTGARVIDATCPRVLANQRIVKEYAEKKYIIIIAGDKNHGEVTALIGEARAAGAEYRVVQNREEAAAVAAEPFFSGLPAVLISQTTIGFEEYEAIKEALCTSGGKVKVFDTICPATEERQKALRTLCKKADGIVVVGGKESANTKRLFQTAASLCAHAVHIERAEELPESFAALKTVGITAGASTPDEIIRDVEKRFESFGIDAGTMP